MRGVPFLSKANDMKLRACVLLILICGGWSSSAAVFGAELPKETSRGYRCGCPERLPDGIGRLSLRDQRARQAQDDALGTGGPVSQRCGEQGRLAGILPATRKHALERQRDLPCGIQCGRRSFAIRTCPAFRVGPCRQGDRDTAAFDELPPEISPRGLTGWSGGVRQGRARGGNLHRSLLV